MSLISIVIPLYNEEVLVKELMSRVSSVMDTLQERFGVEVEAVCVDDGSADNTQVILRVIKDKESRLRVVALSRNFGHQAAFTAGLTVAKGDYIVMMDGDLQDPPELIVDLYQEAMSSGCDVTVARREGRNEPIAKRFGIKMFHWIFDKWSEIGALDDSGNYALMHRRVKDAMLAMDEKSRYLPGIRAFVGFDQSVVTYERPDRELGSAKMDFKRLLMLALDAIFSFSNWPIKVCLYLGIFGLLLIIPATLYSLISKVTDIAPLGWSSTMLSIYFLGAIQLTSLGIIGEYVYRIYKETQNRPHFFIKEIIE